MLGAMSEKSGFTDRLFVSANWVLAGVSVPSRPHGIPSVSDSQPMGAICVFAATACQGAFVKQFIQIPPSPHAEACALIARKLTPNKRLNKSGNAIMTVRFDMNILYFMLQSNLSVTQSLLFVNPQNFNQVIRFWCYTIEGCWSPPKCCSWPWPGQPGSGGAVLTSLGKTETVPKFPQPPVLDSRIVHFNQRRHNLFSSLTVMRIFIGF